MHARNKNHEYSPAIKVKEKEAIASDNKEEDNFLGMEKGQKIKTIKKNKKIKKADRVQT